MTERILEFAPGQRIINESDPQLGLGCVVAQEEGRLVRVFFPAKEQECLYRLQSAPLRRIILRPGQVATSRLGVRFEIERLTEKEGLITYWHGEQSLCETELEDKVPLASSLGRMGYGSVGYPEDLPLRLEAHQLRAQMAASPSYFIGAARVSLLPHQLYVTQRVCSLLQPRVILADEVGLGKTIEAGMIFSVLRAQGRATRVLIVLPDSLSNQWLAEMARRFNEVFNLVDAEALEESDPYLGASRAITPWSALKGGLLEQALQYEWDLLIVDEAHHLHPGQRTYEAVHHLAQASKSVLLLTATPSRGGLETEFGLLHLVDPGRFSQFETYQEERQAWRRGSLLAQRLQNYAQLTEEEWAELFQALGEHFPHDQQLARMIASCKETLAAGRDLAPETRALTNALIDRHGPGRVFFRNRRSRLAGLFCGRQIHPVPLSRQPQENQFPALRELSPAASRQDPRVLWLASYLLSHPQEKVVLIANRQQLVVALQERLREHFGLYAAVFHEGLSVFERDKQAVWFSDHQGVDLLLCSEIGSEGRNFQAAHTLIFWDIPLQADAIEQRIGRLDRIGQKEPVQVYVLYFKGGKEERLFAWHQAIGSFAGPVDGGAEISEEVGLIEALGAPNFREVLLRSRALAQDYKRRAEENVDYLVDLNSFDPQEGEKLALEIAAECQHIKLEGVTLKLLERFGVNAEELDQAGLYHLSPGKNMQVEGLSRLREGGMLATFQRPLALEREELEYLSGSHPLLQEILSFTLDGTEGSASAVTWKKAPSTGLIIQYLFIFEALGQDRLDLGRYLPSKPFLINVALQGQIYKGAIPPPSELKRIKPNTVTKLWGQVGARVEQLTEKVMGLMHNSGQGVRQEALRKARQILEGEKGRLVELHKVNPLVTEAEIAAQEELNERVYAALAEASPRLDSVRLVLLEGPEA